MRISSVVKKQLIEKAKEIIRENKQKNNGGESGIASTFYKINDQWGVKFTTNGREYMTQTYMRQKRGYRVGIAPYCFGIIETTIEYTLKFGNEIIKKSLRITGYITQVADVLSQIWGMFYIDTVPEEFAEEIGNLCDICRSKLGFRFWDYHAQNLGYIDGNMVIIDWGNES